MPSIRRDECASESRTSRACPSSPAPGTRPACRRRVAARRRVEVDELREQRHAADAVGDRVVHLHRERGALGAVGVVETFEQRELPERTGAVERRPTRSVAARRAARARCLVRAAERGAGGSRGRSLLDRPARRAEPERRRQHAWRKPGDEAGRAVDPAPEPVKSGSPSKSATATIVDRRIGSFSTCHMSASSSLMCVIEPRAPSAIAPNGSCEARRPRGSGLGDQRRYTFDVAARLWCRARAASTRPPATRRSHRRVLRRAAQRVPVSSILRTRRAFTRAAARDAGRCLASSCIRPSARAHRHQARAGVADRERHALETESSPHGRARPRDHARAVHGRRPRSLDRGVHGGDVRPYLSRSARRSGRRLDVLGLARPVAFSAAMSP